ncbi:hypothetical protein P171DRAFT_449537 [Karstenula rhodostoma CBS 690.94]|uniref:Uncharacterized protein n=1 Tax=Karstenula rhodostoma CBS 690.94 TaxID=1392251 RepID=A0A9P4U692_9PLEO|nr:hypothetical protein P171DRAFT_449537 [Karstenula rhodostoma CBS 690.94]
MSYQTKAEHKQMLEQTLSRSQAGLTVYFHLWGQYKQLEAEKNTLAMQNARLRSILANNYIALPAELNTSVPSSNADNDLDIPADFDTNTGNMTQTNHIASSGTVNNVTNIYINPNPWDSINDSGPNLSSAPTDRDFNVTEPTATSENGPVKPKYQNKCTRKRCNRGFCEFVHEDQRNFYKKALNKLPFKPNPDEE